MNIRMISKCIVCTTSRKMLEMPDILLFSNVSMFPVTLGELYLKHAWDTDCCTHLSWKKVLTWKTVATEKILPYFEPRRLKLNIQRSFSSSLAPSCEICFMYYHGYPIWYYALSLLTKSKSSDFSGGKLTLKVRMHVNEHHFQECGHYHYNDSWKTTFSTKKKPQSVRGFKRPTSEKSRVECLGILRACWNVKLKS